MQDRRTFIKSASGALALGGLAYSNLSFILPGKTLPDPGVQLFTFFNILDNDVEGVLRKAAEVGVKNIESAFSKKGDYYGLSAGEFSSLLQDLGMKWRAHHVFGTPINLPPSKDTNGNPVPAPKFKNLQENLDQIIDEALEGGLEYLVAAHLPIGTASEIETSLKILNKAAKATNSAGIQLVYHNEPADFKQVEGKVPYEVFLSETDPKALKFELDFAWAVKGGIDPLSLIKRYPGRFPLWHIKDLDRTYETVLPIGEGVLDNAKYFKSAQESGLKYYFIEHEAASDPLKSIAHSIDQLNEITH